MNQGDIQVLYFALFREEARRSEETLPGAGRTPREIYRDLAAKYHFSLPEESVTVAINDAYGSWSTPLAAEDRLAFIAPVSGG